jgi:hypothetical protein
MPNWPSIDFSFSNGLIHDAEDYPLLPGHLVFGVYLSVRLPAPSTVSWVDAGQG